MLTGQRIGVYHLQARIGAGGMGEVYRARDIRLGRDVAIKILPRPFTADPDRLARFEREARVLAALNHPNIAGIMRRSDDHMSASVVRFDLATGRMQTVRHVTVADTSGGRGLTCIVTPDGRTVVYNVGRYLTDLYLVEGLE